MNEIAYGIGEATDEKVVFSFSTEGMHKPITNGDVIKAMFPNGEVYNEETSCVTVKFNGNEYVDFYADWWNAPYKNGSEEP